MDIRKSSDLTQRTNKNIAPETSYLTAITLLFPPAVFLLFTATLALPPTRAATMWILAENHPVEILTFIVLLVAGVFGFRLSWRMRKNGESFFHYGFYFLFSLGLILTAMEEIAWGQQFWAFQTPLLLEEVNMQGEATLHNIRGLHGNTEYFRLLFGLGGMIGIVFALKNRLPKIAPPLVLLSWFAVIAGHASVDVINDIVPIQKEFDAAISKLAELVELLIALAGFLYLWLKAKKFAADAREESAFAGKTFSFSRIRGFARTQ